MPSLKPRAATSDMTHPTLYPARQRRGWWYSDPEHGHNVAYLHADVGFTGKEAQGALGAFYSALT